jgi:hypothetical protein
MGCIFTDLFDCEVIFGVRRPSAALVSDGSGGKKLRFKTKRRRGAAIQSQAKAPDKNTSSGKAS